MILSDRYIKDLLAKNSKLGINPNNINPASVDLTIGREIKEVRTITLNPDKDYDDAMALINLKNQKYFVETVGLDIDGEGTNVYRVSKRYALSKTRDFWIKPDYFYLCHSKEWLEMPDNISAMLVMKSTMGRLGLQHSQSAFVEPTFCGTLTFEITSHIHAPIREGTRFANLVMYETHESDEKYFNVGHYNNSRSYREAWATGERLLEKVSE